MSKKRPVHNSAIITDAFIRTTGAKIKIMMTYSIGMAAN
jgi:hypothetical protein